MSELRKNLAQHHAYSQLLQGIHTNDTSLAPKFSGSFLYPSSTYENPLQADGSWGDLLPNSALPRHSALTFKCPVRPCEPVLVLSEATHPNSKKKERLTHQEAQEMANEESFRQRRPSSYERRRHPGPAPSRQQRRSTSSTALGTGRERGLRGLGTEPRRSATARWDVNWHELALLPGEMNTSK